METDVFLDDEKEQRNALSPDSPHVCVTAGQLYDFFIELEEFCVRRKFVGTNSCQ